MNIVGISASPSARSRSASLLDAARERLLGHSTRWTTIAIRDLPAQPLLHAQLDHPSIRQALGQIADADLVLIATPIYKAAYSGLLKVFLDLLPQDGLRGKCVLPLITGGSAGHLLALDYSVRPVLSALGARDVLDGVFATDLQIESVSTGYSISADTLGRLERALSTLLDRPQTVLGPVTDRLRCSAPASDRAHAREPRPFLTRSI